MRQALAIRTISNKCAKVLVVTSWTPFSKSAHMCFFKNAGLSEFHFLDLSRRGSVLQPSFLFFFFFCKETPRVWGAADSSCFLLQKVHLKRAFGEVAPQGGGASKLGDRGGVLEEL